MTYQLSIQKIQDICLFELTWGSGQRLRTRLTYPPQLETRYQQWQRAYLNFYKRALRGRVGAVGQVSATGVDWHSQLVQAEARLLSEFHRWLRQGELADIRQTIGAAARDAPLDLFLTCDPIAIARLPWETWEIGAEFGGRGIRIARSPNNIRLAALTPTPKHRKARVLVILGDETGLNFQGDRQALQSLKSLVDITFVGWTPGQDTVALKTAICKAIANPQGWDILFFAGHSNEADAVAGHIYIAPQTALAIRELLPYLQTARSHGLQFALFNSCCGLTIADALIELGLSQVAIMREPIHNQVAHNFLVQFLQSLAHHRDVHDSLQDACRHLKLEQHLTYPSADLVPSLFRHPDSVPFRIPPRGWRQELRQWLPNPQQAIALSVIFLLCVLPGVQEGLLSARLLVQAMYRHWTRQIPETSPEVLLVQIDDASRREAPELVDISPIDRGYLARIVDRLYQQQVKVIGIDYLLDFPQPDRSPILANSVREAVRDNNTWLVFGAILEGGREMGVRPESEILDSAWAMQGYTNMPKWYLALPWGSKLCEGDCPFPYVLAAAARYQTRRSETDMAIAPNLDRQTPLRSDLIDAIASSDNPELQNLARLRISFMTALGGHLNQRWLRPIVDFSLPPDRVFYRISARDLLQDSLDPKTTQAIARSSVAIVGGVGYVEGGIEPFSSDIYPNPPAVAYWREVGRDDSHEDTIAGVEAVAYNIHHLMNSHLVTPVPALWWVGVAAIVGSAIALYGIPKLETRQQGIWVMAMGTTTYGWMALQIAVSAGILLPWLLPSTTIWIYCLPNIWRLSKQ
jgi:hypothetical protein